MRHNHLLHRTRIQSRTLKQHVMRHETKQHNRRYCMQRWLIALLVLLLPQIAQAGDAPADLTAAVDAYIKKKGGLQQPAFRHALTDLNGDAQADAVVLLLGDSWCGSGGCKMLDIPGDKKRVQICFRKHGHPRTCQGLPGDGPRVENSDRLLKGSGRCPVALQRDILSRKSVNAASSQPGSGRCGANRAGVKRHRVNTP